MDDTTHIGLDVHKPALAKASLARGATVRVVVAESGRGVRRGRSGFRELPRDPVQGGGKARQWWLSPQLPLRSWSLRHGRHRLLTTYGYSRILVAPTDPDESGHRVKADRSDAMMLAKLAS